MLLPGIQRARAEEPAFPEDATAPLLDWRGMSEIPGVFAARMRRV